MAQCCCGGAPTEGATLPKQSILKSICNERVGKIILVACLSLALVGIGVLLVMGCTPVWLWGASTFLMSAGGVLTTIKAFVYTVGGVATIPFVVWFIREAYVALKNPRHE